MEFYRNHICNRTASTCVENLTETATQILIEITEVSITGLDFSDFTLDQVNSEHLCVLLRTTYRWKDDIKGWNLALEVAKEALDRDGIDKEDALYGILI